jgi:ParB-like chromosome segregation protein Spo0J
MRTENIREVLLEEIADLPVHPVAAIFPTLAENSSDRDNGKPDKQTITLAELADSITEFGLQEPIVLFDSENGKVLLDGRNRRLACILGKVETVRVEDFIGSEEEAHEFIFTLNLDRRDMTPGQRAKAAAEYWEIEAERAKERVTMAQDAGRATRYGHDLEGGKFATAQETGKTRAILAQRFRAGQKYVDLIHKELAAIERERARAEELQAQAKELELREKEAEAKIELAQATGNTQAVKDAAKERNEAANNKVDLREKAAVEAEKASKRQRKVDRVQKGESVNSVYGETKDPENDSPDPVGKLRTSINSSVANLKKSITDLATTTGQGEDDYNFVGRKISEVVDHFDSVFGVEDAG